MNILKREEIVSYIAEDVQITKVETRLILDSMAECIKDALKNGQGVELYGLGKLSVIDVPPREYKNPKTGNNMLSPGKKKIKFNASSKIRELINSDIHKDE